jgi:hypothetical protein
MRTAPMLTTVAGIGLLVMAVGCSSDDSDPYPTTYNCDADDRDEAFTANMARTGSGTTLFTIVSAQPALPIRGDNTWIIDVAKSGAPMTAADATFNLTPFMPDHRHGSGIKPVWTPDAAVPGRFSVGPINLWMPGIWELTFDATPTAAPRDSVKFTFCITG